MPTLLARASGRAIPLMALGWPPAALRPDRLSHPRDLAGRLRGRRSHRGGPQPGRGHVEDAGPSIGHRRRRQLASAHVARAAPGYTLLIHHNGMATAPALYRKLSFNPLTDFAYVGQVADVPMTLLGRKDLPPGDMAGFIKYARDNGNKINLANAGLGAVSQLCGMLLQEALGTQFTTVPYAGTAPALTGHAAEAIENQRQAARGAEGSGLHAEDGRTGRGDRAREANAGRPASVAASGGRQGGRSSARRGVRGLTEQLMVVAACS